MLGRPLALGGRFGYRTATVLACIGVGVVGEPEPSRCGNGLSRCQRIVRPAHIALGSGCSFLGYCHVPSVAQKCALGALISEVFE